MTYQVARLDGIDARAVETSIRRRFRTLGTRSYEVRGRLDAATVLDAASCRDVGLRIDGTPVLVRGEGRGFEGCEPVELDSGWHTLRTGSKPTIRRVWLSTGASATTAARGGTDTASLSSLGRAQFEIEARTNGPAAIVSGQSADDGWSATIDGRDVGAPIPLDTQAAWRVSRAGDHRLDAHQTSQDAYRIALVITGIGLLLCGWLVVRGRFR
jgi:hypothetical protein